MSSDYTIHKLEINDFKLLIPLMQDCFGMDVNINYFEWKFANNPSGFVEGYYAKHSSGEIAAYYGAIPESYIIDGNLRIIYQSCDTMTHSNHRRKGLFQQLALHCFNCLKEDGKLFIIGFGGGQSTPGFIKFGWQEIFKARYYFYPRIFKSFQFLKSKGIEEILNYDLIEHLTLLSNKDSTIHSHKSAEAYKWRVSNPLYEYKTVAIKGENNLYESYLTYYQETDKLFIFDFYIGNSHSGKYLFNFLKSKLDRRYKGIVAFAQENSKFSSVVKHYGFISNPLEIGPLHEKVPFIFFAPHEVMVNSNNPKIWQINSFDHDAL